MLKEPYVNILLNSKKLLKFFSVCLLTNLNFLLHPEMIYWIIFLRVNIKYYISDLWFIRVCVYMLIHILVPLTPRYYCKGILLWFSKTSQAEKWAGVLSSNIINSQYACDCWYVNAEIIKKQLKKRLTWLFQGVSNSNENFQ